MAQRYTVYTVLGDGNPFDVLTTEDPREALDMLDQQHLLYQGFRHRCHGIFDPDDEERGDITVVAEELIGLRIEQRADDAPFRGKKEVTPTRSPAHSSTRGLGGAA